MSTKISKPRASKRKMRHPEAATAAIRSKVEEKRQAYRSQEEQEKPAWALPSGWLIRLYEMNGQRHERKVPAGTSYLEALRAIAQFNPGLFKDILQFGVECYPADRTSYHVSAESHRIPNPSDLRDDELPRLLDNFHAREVLHVTYGSVLKENRFRAPFFETLQRYEEDYIEIVETHFDRHLALFG